MLVGSMRFGRYCDRDAVGWYVSEDGRLNFPTLKSWRMYVSYYYGAEIDQFLLWFTCTILGACVVLACVYRVPNMIVRRISMSSDDAISATAMAVDGTVDPSYATIHDGDDDDELAYRAIVSDLRDSRGSNGTHSGGLWLLESNALPCLRVSDTLHDQLGIGVTNAGLNEMVIQAMLDDPTLSISTCGQGYVVNVNGCAYGVQITEQTASEIRTSDDERTVREEVAAVNAAADGIADGVRAITGNGADYRTYANVAYSLLASRCVYSDGTNDTDHTNDVYGCLVEHESQCYGMAGAMHMVLDRLGVPNVIVRGITGSGGAHAIDLAWIGSEWQALDLTIGAGHPYDMVYDWCLDDATDTGVKPLSQYQEHIGFTPDGYCQSVMDDYAKEHAHDRETVNYITENGYATAVASAVR